MRKIINSIHPDDDYHYQKMGLKRGIVEPWEDGLRTDGSRGTYEWWYTDAHFSDGTIVVVIFFNKSPIEAGGPVKPQATIEVTLPDGRKFSDQVCADIKDSLFATEHCDVRVGESRIVGDLKHYDITFKGERITATLALDGTIPSWRSQTGSIFFGDNEEHYFAWLPSIPEGRAVADIALDGKELHLEGSGYHDHNWGDQSMLLQMHHWYWGRAKIGDYKVISSWITGEKKYGYKDHDVFMIAKGGEILGDNSNHTLKFLPTDRYIDRQTGKPVFGKVVYEYTTEAGEEYRITYARKDDISKQNFIDLLSGPVKLGAKLIGFDGAYLRFEGEASVEKIENGVVVEKVAEPSAVWELMYFGKACADERFKESRKMPL
jgi:hypothetical protein